MAAFSDQYKTQQPQRRGQDLLQIMKQHGVGADDIARVVREVIPAMIDDSLEGPNCAEQGRLAVVKTGETEADWEADTVNGNRFEGMVVEGAVGEWHVDIMVHRVNMFYKSSVSSTCI